MTNGFMLALNSFIANVALNGIQGSLSPDMKLDTVGFFSGDDDVTTPYARLPLDRRLCLHFTGVVTRVAAKGSLPICEAFGTQFYLQPGHLANSGNESFCLAWSVPVQKPHASGKSRAQDGSKGTCPLAIKATTVEYQFYHKAVLHEKTFSMELKLYSLVPEPSFEPSQEENSYGYAALRRPLIEEQAVNAPKGKGKGGGSIKRPAKFSAEELQAQQTWHQCKHLFR